MAVQFRDYYETLGVSKTASEDEIRSAFRKLARKYHPDVAKDKKTAEEKFKQINEAYEVLSDPEKRRKYDRLGENWNQPGGFQPPPQWGGGQPGGFRWGSGENGGVEFEFGGTGFSDFFEAFFGGGRGRSAFGGFGQRGTMAERGNDVEADIMVTLEEALHGSTRQVSLRRAGSKKTETYQVKIPRGVREGQRIRLAGQGEAGERGGKSGVNRTRKIPLGSDHAGFKMKEKVRALLGQLGDEVKDVGTFAAEPPVDYPLFIRPAAEAVARGKCERGIVFGGYGNGEAMVANKVHRVRCALCWNLETARLSRQHNDANVLSLGERVIEENLALEIVPVWLTTKFES